MTIPPWQIQAAFTPPLIKRLIQIICMLTLSAVSIDSFFGTELQGLLLLSPLAFESYYLWQPITSLFLVPAAHFSFGFLLDLAFAMLLLWLLGSLLYERIGKNKFLFVYIASGLFSAAAALLCMYLFSLFAYVSVCLPAILAVATLWTMADPNMQLNIFFLFPIRARWILVFALLGTLLNSLINRDFVSFSAYAAAFLFSYIYGLAACDFSSPFDWMKKAETRIKQFWSWQVCGKFRKIFRKDKDDLFIETTLEKISKEGESSLSPYEKLRLRWISFKRRHGS